MEYIHVCKPIYILVLDLTTDGLLDSLTDQSYPIIFKCKAFGEPMPNIRWYFNYEKVSNEGEHNISTSTNGSLVESSLKIVNPHSSDLGKYTCTASNVVINKQKFAVLTANSKHLAMLCIFV